MSIRTSASTSGLRLGLLCWVGIVLFGLTPAVSAEGNGTPEPVAGAFNTLLGAAHGPLGFSPIFINKTGAGRIRINGTIYTLPYSDFDASGETLTIEPVPDVHWGFSHWSGDVTGNANPLVLYVDGPKTFTVNFVQTEYILSLTLTNGSGHVKVNGTERELPWSETLAVGSAVTLEALPDYAWIFGYWNFSMNFIVENPTTFTMDRDQDVWVVFYAGPIYVDKDNVSGVEDGLSWATAFTRIQTAINRAVATDRTEVWVAEGVYDEVRDNATGSVKLKPHVWVSGGFAGNEVSWSQRNAAAHVTVIDGSTAHNGEPAGPVVLAEEDGYDYSLDSFTVTGGEGFGTGGGMFIGAEVDSIGVYDCTFRDNHANLNLPSDKAGGGAILIEDGGSSTRDVRISDCRFESNSAVSDIMGGYLPGGAICCYSGGGIHIVRCTFKDNHVNEGGDLDRLALGGAVYILDTKSTFIDCLFENNTTLPPYSGTHRGGAVCVCAEAQFDNCVFRKNVAGNGGYSSSEGGALFAYTHDLLELNNCTFVGNFAGQGGALNCGTVAAEGCSFDGNEAISQGAGAFVWWEGSQFAACTFRGNILTPTPGWNIGEGAAIYIRRSGGVTVERCLFEENSMTGDLPYELLAGGIYCSNASSVEVSNSVFRANGPSLTDADASGKGGGIYIETGGVARVVNCTFYGHHLPGGQSSGGAIWAQPQLPNEVRVWNSIFWNNTAPSSPNIAGAPVTYSDVQGGYSGFGNINVDPRFLDADAGDLRLAGNSPCVDQGTDTDAPLVDYLGIARPQNYGWDMGAYETVVEGFTLSLYKAGSGLVLVNDAWQGTPWYHTFPAGEEVSLQAVPDLGWIFSYWSGDLTGTTASATITLSENRTVRAHFHPFEDMGPMRTLYYPKFRPNSTLDVTVTMTNGGGPVTQLILRETLPAGWSFVSVVSPNPPAVRPEPGSTGTIQFAWQDIPAFPAALTYRVQVPAGQSGKKTFTGEVLFKRGPVETSPQLEVAVGGISSVMQRLHHSLDYQGPQGPDYRISLQELLRLIQFYNSGGYHADPSRSDHYGPGPGPQDGAPHDSDGRNQNWQISLTELLRAIQFYNVGGYHVADGTEDGFAPGL